MEEKGVIYMDLGIITSDQTAYIYNRKGILVIKQ